jgi:hypothetical protein
MIKAGGWTNSSEIHNIINSIRYKEKLPEESKMSIIVSINTLRTGSFKLFKRPFPGFLTILTL